MKITKIERQKHNLKRYSVFLDGKYKFGIHKELIAQLNLKKGKEIDNTELERIKQLSELI